MRRRPHLRPRQCCPLDISTAVAATVGRRPRRHGCHCSARGGALDACKRLKGLAPRRQRGQQRGRAVAAAAAATGATPPTPTVTPVGRQREQLLLLDVCGSGSGAGEPRPWGRRVDQGDLGEAAAGAVDGDGEMWRERRVGPPRSRLPRFSDDGGSRSSSRSSSSSSSSCSSGGCGGCGGVTAGRTPTRHGRRGEGRMANKRLGRGGQQGSPRHNRQRVAVRRGGLGVCVGPSCASCTCTYTA